MNERMASCCNNDSADWRPLNARQRWARFLVGLVLLLLALALPRSTTWSTVLAVIAIWLGATHVLAAAMAYPGCPELGAAPSLLLGRWVRIGCTPWRMLDGWLRLTAN